MRDEIAWAAGVFDARGTVTTARGRRRLQLKSSSEPLVRRFCAAVNRGVVYGPYGPYDGQIGRGAWFMWVCDGPGVTWTLHKLWPLLSETTRDQMQEARQPFAAGSAGTRNG